MVYSFECEGCGKRFDVSRTVEERNAPCTCPECEDIAKRVLTTVPFKINGYSEKNGYSKSIGDIVKRNGKYKSDEEGTHIE